MNKKEDELQSQNAPLKNTDDAYVEVGKDGNPVYPKENREKDQNGTDRERGTDLDKR